MSKFSIAEQIRNDFMLTCTQLRDTEAVLRAMINARDGKSLGNNIFEFKDGSTLTLNDSGTRIIFVTAAKPRSWGVKILLGATAVALTIAAFAVVNQD